jgi:putative PIN family toxin of toxin-antitoxin system
MRAVLDTSVMVAALRSDQGASRVLLVGALEERYRLLASVPLMVEYEAVLTRQEHLEAGGLSSGDMQDVLDAVASIIEPVRLAYLWRPTLPDAQDDMVLETAMNGRAEVLVTFNRRHFEPAASTFAVQVVSPAEAVARLRKPR